MAGGIRFVASSKAIRLPNGSQAYKWSTIEMFFFRERSRKITTAISARNI